MDLISLESNIDKYDQVIVAEIINMIETQFLAPQDV